MIRLENKTIMDPLPTNAQVHVMSKGLKNPIKCSDRVLNDVPTVRTACLNILTGLEWS